MVRLNKIHNSMKSTNTETKLAMPELPTGSVMVSEPPKSEVLGNTSESGVIKCLHMSINGCKKRTKCCGSVILRVIRMVGDIWRECIDWGLREEAEK